MLVRSMKAMVYMIRATGMMRSQRCEGFSLVGGMRGECITGPQRVVSTREHFSKGSPELTFAPTLPFTFRALLSPCKLALRAAFE